MADKLNWSNQFKINFNDIKSIAMTAGIVALSAGATYLVNEVGKMDWGIYTPIITVVAATALKALDRWRRPTP